MAQQIKLSLVTMASHTGDGSPSWLLHFQLPTKALEKAAEDSPSAWAAAPHVRDLGSAPGSWLWSGPTKGWTISLSLSLTLSDKQMNL